MTLLTFFTDTIQDSLNQELEQSFASPLEEISRFFNSFNKHNHSMARANLDKSDVSLIKSIKVNS
jgi:hypothetical protein